MTQQAGTGSMVLGGWWSDSFAGLVTDRTYQWNAADEGGYWTFCVPKAGTIKKLYWHLSAVGTADNVEVSLQTLGTDGRPSGTNYGGSSTTTEATPAAGLMTTTFATGATAVRGDLIAAYITIPTGSTADITIFAADGGSGHDIGTGRLYQDIGAGWAETFDIASFVIEYSDGSIEPIRPNIPPCTLAQESYDDADDPDERGIEFELLYPARLVGIIFRGRLVGTSVDVADLFVYKGSTAQGTKTTINSEVYNQGSPDSLAFFFKDAHSVAANESWRVTLKGVHASSTVALDVATLLDATHHPHLGVPGATTWQYTSRNDGGAFTESTTKVPLIALVFDGFDDGAGAMAAGDSLYIWDAAAAKLPATRFATFDTFASADTPAGTHLVLDFSDEATNTEFADFVGVMPGQYDGTTALEVVLHWSSDATSGDVKWDVSFKRITDDEDDLDTVTFATIQTVTATTATAAGEMDYAVVDLTNAQADGIQPSEQFIIRVERDSADAADTLTLNDAEIHTVELRLNS